VFGVTVAGTGSVDGAPASAATSATAAGGAAGGSGELAEDMLQMALRMASEMSEEPVMDLEDSVNPAPVRRGVWCFVVTVYLHFPGSMLNLLSYRYLHYVSSFSGVPRRQPCPTAIQA